MSWCRSIEPQHDALKAGWITGHRACSGRWSLLQSGRKSMEYKVVERNVQNRYILAAPWWEHCDFQLVWQVRPS